MPPEHTLTTVHSKQILRKALPQRNSASSSSWDELYIGRSPTSLFWRFVKDRFGFRVPVNSLPGPIRACGHHAGYGVRKSVVHGRVGLFAAAQAIEPVGHVRGFFIAHSHGGETCLAGQQDIFDGPL